MCIRDSLVLDDEGEQLGQIHYNPPRLQREKFRAVSSHYGNNCRQPASDQSAARAGDFVGSLQGPEQRRRATGGRGGAKSVRRELRTGRRGKDGGAAGARM